MVEFEKTPLTRRKEKKHADGLVLAYRWARIFGLELSLRETEQQVLEQLIPGGQKIRSKSQAAKELQMAPPDLHTTTVRALRRLGFLAHFTYVEDEGRAKTLVLSSQGYRRLSQVGISSLAQLRTETVDSLKRKGLSRALVDTIKNKFKELSWYLPKEEEKETWNLIAKAQENGGWEKLTPIQRKYLTKRYPTGRESPTYQEIALGIKEEEGIEITNVAVLLAVKRATRCLRELYGDDA